MNHIAMVLLLTMLATEGAAEQETSRVGETVNSVGIRLRHISAGNFIMGADAMPLSKEIVDGVGVMSARQVAGDFDEVPTHQVTLTKDFDIAVSEITVEQYHQFDPLYTANPAHPDYVTGISWERAAAFCEWLSKTEGKSYRLPTEAEWEYVARAGSKTIYSTGDRPLAVDTPNLWGIGNMESGRPEWTLDWYAPYTATSQTDPLGPCSGITKVVRGGGLDSKAAKNSIKEGPPSTSMFYRRPANRASMAPPFQSPVGNISFRVVQAEMPKGECAPESFTFMQTAVKQTTRAELRGPNATKPYYRARPLLPDIHPRVSIDMTTEAKIDEAKSKDARTMIGDGWRLGLARGLGVNWHNSAIQQLPNGDLLAAYYNNQKLEDDPDQTIITMRRRAGSEEWDMPEPFPYFADAANAAPVIWNDEVGRKIWFFWGTPRMIGNVPFYYISSTDNGVHWTPVQVPVFPRSIGRYVSQPINSVVRAKDGSIYIPTDSTGKDADGNGSISAVWATSDDGKTWRDTGGRTAGRHSTIVMRNDGAILAYGGKNSAIDKRMPLAISTDKGKTWVKEKTPFDVLGSGERPSIIRLASRRLFFVEDQNPTGRPKKHDEGAQVALSEDEGATWHIKKLPTNIKSVGYTTATQTKDGLIHIVTSKNDPENMEIELNEAWIQSSFADVSTVPKTIAKVTKHRETYGNGKVYVVWSDGVADTGEILLEGPETFYYSSGKPMWKLRFHLGNKIGVETYYRADSTRVWQKMHAKDGTYTWLNYDVHGRLVATSHWTNKRLDSVTYPETR